MTLFDDILLYPNLVATLALFVSFLSIIIGVGGLWLQRRHNILSVRPIGVIALEDCEHRLIIKIKNEGMGPMICKSMETSDHQGNKSEAPIDFMPPNILWSHFGKNVKYYTIKVGDHKTLLDYKFDNQDDKSAIEFAIERDHIRSILKNLTIKIKYADIYGNIQPISCRKLDWFGRNL